VKLLKYKIRRKSTKCQKSRTKEIKNPKPENRNPKSSIISCLNGLAEAIRPKARIDLTASV